MTRDINVLRTWILIVAIIAALGATAVPAIYFFTPWRQELLGKLFMIKALSFAMAMDTSVVFMIWKPSDVLVVFWIDAVILTAIATSTSALAWLIWQLKRTNGKYEWKGWQKLLFTDKVYSKLKFIALVLLPALASAYFALAQIWHLPHVEQVLGTLGVLDTFLGALLGISTKTYNAGTLQQPKKYDGLVSIEAGPDGTLSQLRLHDLDPKAVSNKPEITLKVFTP